MKAEHWLLIGGLGLAAYYFLIAKPKTDVEAAYAGGLGLGTGAVSTAGQGFGDFFGNLLSGLSSVIPSVSAAAPRGAPAIQPNLAAAAQQRVLAGQAWAQIGGTRTGGILTLPTPTAQVSGLSVYPQKTPLLAAALGKVSLPQATALITTPSDIARLQTTQAKEAVIKAQTGGQVVGHRVQAGQDIYTVKLPSGATQIIRK